MGKDRVITGFGPSSLSVTNSTGVKETAWLKFGPFKGNQLSAAFTFGTATSGALVSIWGAMTTAATGSWKKIISQTGNLATVKTSTEADHYAYIKVRSTSRASSTAVTSNAITAYFAAVP
jgi:hypothetical protein